MGRIKNILASWKSTFALMTLYAIIMGIATFVEAEHGTALVREMFYHAVWFFILHILLVLNFIFISLKQRLLARKMWGVLLLHYGFLVIIIGAITTHTIGYEGFMHIREGESSDTILVDSKTPKKIPLRVTLKDFNMERYSGSNSPSSFRSEVTIEYKGEKKDFSIYMNNIARVGGFRLYQTSYDSDQQGTVLTVNSDSIGAAVTYLGYVMLILGLIVSVCARNSRLRTLSRSLTKGTVTALLVLLCANANATPREVNVERDHAARFAELIVQTPDGRLEPVDTYASEILRKLYHGNSYKGLAPEQVLIGLLIDPEHWAGEPIIYIRRGEYRTFNSMFDPADGSYRLAKEIETITAKPPKERTKSDKEAMKLDEKVNILYSLFQDTYFAVFPTPQRERWYSAGEDLSSLSGKDSLLISKIMLWYASELKAGNNSAADEVLELIKKYQRAQSTHFNIDHRRIKAEVTYNRADFFRVAFRGLLICGFLLLMVTLLRGAYTDSKPLLWCFRLLFVLIAALALYQSVGIAMRWYISGRAPWTNAYESMVYVGWVTVVAGLCLVRKSPLVTGLAALLAGVVLFVANLNWLDPQITPLVPVLKSHWLMIHVSVITASYGLFGISAMCGISNLVAIIAGHQARQLRIINEMAMIVGLVLLTAGIFLGAVWANESWGRYWGWDPKETWALITMVVYAATIHARFVKSLSNPFVFSTLSIVGILCVLMTFFGVSFYLSGLHSYAGAGEVPLVPLLSGTGVLAALIGVAAYRYYKS